MDGLILVCAGAGGHGGQLSPFGFVSAVKKFFKGTIILSGSISTGEEVLAAQIIGADYAYMGTRFLLVMKGIPKLTKIWLLKVRLMIFYIQTPLVVYL